MKAGTSVGRKRIADDPALLKEPFRLLVEQTADAIFCYENEPPISVLAPIREQIERMHQAVLVTCNEAYARNYGADRPEEIVGRRLTDVVGTECGDLDKLFSQFIEGGYRLVETEAVETLPNGSRRYFVRNARGVIENDTLVRVWGTLRDITTRKEADRALRESEAKARALVDANPDLVFRLDHEGRFLDFHAGDQSDLALPSKDFLGRRLSDLFSPEFATACQRHIDKTLETGELQVFEYELSIQDMDREFEARFIRCGEFDVIVTIRDFTGRKRTLQQLRISEARLKEAQRIGRAGCWELDIEKKKLWWSDECYAIFGAAPGAFAPTMDTFMDSVHPSDRERVLGARKRGIQDSEAYELEYRIVTPEGSERNMYARGEPIVDDKGRPRILGIVRDITEYRQAEAQLRLSETRLKEAQQMAKVCNWERNLLTNEVWWSDETYRLLGLDPEQSVASYESYLERLHPDDRGHALPTDQLECMGVDEFEREYRIVQPSGEVRVMHTRAKVSFDADGQPKRLTGTSQDITDRVELERQIVAGREEEQRRLGQELHDGLGQTLVGAFFSSQNLCKLLENEDSPHAQTAKRLSETLQRAIGDSKHISQSLYPAVLDTLGLGSALKVLAEEANDYAIAWVRAHCKGDISFRDTEVEGHLYRIAQEALTNALKHASAHNIELRYECNGRQWCLEVLDDGVGLPPVGERVDGMGLKGMRYRARIVHSSLTVECRPEGGTRVSCCCTVPA